MPWTITKPKPGDSTVIMDGSRLVGSIAGSEPDIHPPGEPYMYRVEVLWSGPSGDITFDTPHFERAEAFVRGVEAALNATLGYLERIAP